MEPSSSRVSEKTSERIFLIVSLLLVGTVFYYACMMSIFAKPTYTIEVYEIFEVDHVENEDGHWTCVYTYGQSQFYFRGDHDINASKSYTFVYQENLKRWRDLTLLDYWEITPLVKDEDCPTCPE